MDSIFSLQHLHSRLQNKRGVWQKKLEEQQNRRLFSGLTLVFLLLASQIFKGYFLEVIATFLILPFFLYFLVRSRQIKYFMDRLQNLSIFYQKQIDFHQGQIQEILSPNDMHDSFLARDLDLNRFFCGINFSFSLQGEEQLNQWLCQHFKSSEYSLRQKHLKEICHLPGLIRRLLSINKTEKIDFFRLEREVKKTFIPEISWKWLIPTVWFCLILTLFSPTPLIVIKLFLFFYIALVLSFLQKSKDLFLKLQDLQTDFLGLGERIFLLEKLGTKLSFTPHLKKSEVSSDIKQMGRLIALLSLKTNPIVYYLINLLLPWDFIVSEICERKRQKFYENFKNWSLEIVYLETLSCLSTLKTYHQTVWAEINPNDFLCFKGLSHPLLNQELVISNDFNPERKRIFIITGSNMSGKSTFLRAMGLNFCLANIGAPVFAKEFRFRPMQILSCIRVSDSLRDGQSYFYAEVQRLKLILESAKAGEILFLIDEPLRGTNNRERLIGNQKYLSQILHLKSQGFLSTHDLELTQLSEQSVEIANYHFSELWEKEDLKFDYKLKPGPSQSTNALKILAREGLY